jgi:hypothetical protein
MIQPPTPRVVTPVRGANSILAERADAFRIRQDVLEKEKPSGSLLVDLGNVRIITFSAADELIAKWLVWARAATRRDPLVVGIYSSRPVVQETLHAVLRPYGQAAYLLKRGTDPGAEDPELIGDVTRVNEETLRQLQLAGPKGLTPAQLAGELGLADTAAANRLQELSAKGLILKETRTAAGRGRPALVYRYPYPTKTPEANRARRPVRAPA